MSLSGTFELRDGIFAFGRLRIDERLQELARLENGLSTCHVIGHIIEMIIGHGDLHVIYRTRSFRLARETHVAAFEAPDVAPSREPLSLRVFLESIEGPPTSCGSA